MSDVSGIPYMGPMGVGNLMAPLYPALSGGGNMTAAQIQAPYMPEVNYNQSVLSPYNLYGPGGFGAATDYYSALGASYGRATGGFGGGGGGNDPWLDVSLPAMSQPDYGGGGGLSAYDYTSLYGGGGAATPPSSYGYGSLYGSGGGIGGLGGGQADPFPGMAWPGGLNQPMALPSMGGGQLDPYPGMAMPGGLGQPMAQPSSGGGIGGLGGGWGNAPQAMPDMQRLLGYNPPSQFDFPPPPMQPQPMGYDYGSLYGGGGNSLGGRLAQAMGGVDPAWPAAQRNAGLVGPVQSALSFDPSGYSRGYGNAGGFGGDPNWGGFGQGGGGIGGGAYDPFNVGSQWDPSLYAPSGPGGDRGGGLFQGGFAGAGGAQMADIRRLLGYDPQSHAAGALDFNERFPTGMSPALDVQAGLQPGIDSLLQTLGGIDRATGGGSTLSPQDRQIRFSGGGFREPSFFGPGGIGGGSSYTDPGLPLEITQGGSTPGGAMFSDFNRSLFGNAPAYPPGVVRGPYALPDVGAEGGFAGAPGAARGGALPFASDYFGGPGSGGGWPEIANRDRTFTLFDSPDARDAITFGGIGGGGALNRPISLPGGEPDVFGGYEGGYGSNRNMPGEMTYSPALDATFVKPEYRTANVFRALQDTAANSGFRDANGLPRPDVLSPSALAMMIQGETKWNPNDTSPGGKYRGLTQIGPENEFYSFTGPDGPFGVADLTPAQQIRAYFDWLNHPEHNVPNTTRNAGLSLAGMSPIEQAAYLQGTQFSPNPLDWRQQLAAGNIDYRFARGQAPEMQTPPTKAGDVTMRSLQDYYQQMNANPPWYPQTSPWAGFY